MRALVLLVVVLGMAGTAGCRMLRQHAGPAAYVDDSSIDARVEIALVHDPSIDAREIDVHTFNGKVTLDGVVDSDAMKRTAERITHATPGVRSVASKLRVASPLRAAPANR
ncbi:MAG: BON domain-containing protein [Steroidobacteraceae bacterium]